MPDATAAFFAGLAEHGHERLLEHATGTVCFELSHGHRTDRWAVAIRAGDVAVSRDAVDADLTVSMDKALFDRIARGETNAMAQILRGSIGGHGDLQLFMQFQRIFPGPPRAGEATALPSRGDGDG